MNYEQKYAKALWQMKELYNRVKYMSSTEALLVSQTLENTFPELKESEDERIRKGLIKGLSAMRDIHKHQTFSDDAINIDDAIAWLEKQGEQKPTPKFKIGDTIHKIGENTVFPRTIEKIEDGDYVCNNSHSFVNIKFQDDYELVEQKPAWSEDDEKMKSLIISILTSMGTLNLERYHHMNLDEVKNWLKSLKPNHWKPSEFQLKCLKKVIPHDNTEKGCELEDVLTELYDNLKKL